MQEKQNLLLLILMFMWDENKGKAKRYVFAAWKTREKKKMRRTGRPSGKASLHLPHFFAFSNYSIGNDLTYIPIS